MATAEPPKRLLPVVKRGKTKEFRSIPTLYLDDVETIHAIMAHHMVESALDREIARSHAESVATYNKELEEYNAWKRRYANIGKEVPDLPPFPPVPIYQRERKVMMRSDEFIFDSLEQLESVSNKRDHFTRFTMHIDSPWLYLSCSPLVFSLNTTDSDANAIEAFDRVCYVLKIRESKPAGLLLSPLVMVIAALFALAISSLLALTIGNGGFWVGIALWGAVMALFLGFQRMIWPNRRGVVIPRTKMDAPPFAWRNKDAILVGVIIGVVIGLVGIVARLVSRLI